MGGWLANKMTEGLLGVNAREVSFITDYFRSGTGLPNLVSDQKDGGQYIRNRKGMAGLLMTYNVPSKNTTQETCSSLSVLLASFQKRLSSSQIQSQTSHNRHQATTSCLTIPRRQTSHFELRR
jgi:hypothetical protein